MKKAFISIIKIFSSFLLALLLQSNVLAIPIILEFSETEITFLHQNLITWNPELDFGDRFLIDIHYDTSDGIKWSGDSNYSTYWFGWSGTGFDIRDSETNELLYFSGGNGLEVTVFDNVPDPETSLIIDMIEFFTSETLDTYTVCLKGPQYLLYDTLMPKPDKFLWFTDGFAQHKYYGRERVEATFNPETGTVIPEPSTMFLIGAGLIALAGLGKKRFKKKD